MRWFMRERRYCSLAVIAAAVLILAGCGEKFPELTEDEYQQTVEYAVGVLMKHSNNGHERLVYVDAKEEKKARERQARKDAQRAEEENAASVEQLVTKPEEKPVEKPVEEPSWQIPAQEPVAEATEGGSADEGMEATALTSEPEEHNMTGEDIAAMGDSIDTSTEAAGVKEDDTIPGSITLSSDESQELAPDLFLSYQGYSVSSTYPESSKSYVVNADKGSKLLVLRFDLYNGSDSDKEVNMLKYNLLFQVLLNDKNIGYTSVTFLPNDLSSYIGTIESRAHESLVVLTQIKESEATSIEKLGMIVSENGVEQTVNLK
jgi:hypothetical protein